MGSRIGDWLPRDGTVQRSIRCFGQSGNDWPIITYLIVYYGGECSVNVKTSRNTRRNGSKVHVSKPRELRMFKWKTVLTRSRIKEREGIVDLIDHFHAICQ